MTGVLVGITSRQPAWLTMKATADGPGRPIAGTGGTNLFSTGGGQ